MDGEHHIGNGENTLKDTAARYLPDVWTEVSNQLRQRPDLYLFLDYDGSLVPIADTPEKAILPPERRQVLNRLSQCPGIHVWVISGRLIDDIRQLVGVEGIGYSGNHGLEIQCPNQPAKEFYTPDHKETILKAQELLQGRLAQYKGILFENKGPILAIHYRLAEAGVDQEILRTVETIRGSVPGSFTVGHGKKVIEIRTVPDRSKGTALNWIKENVQGAKNLCRVYIGDDVTDEDAFKVLNADDIGIFIGKPSHQTAAKYYLLTVDEVWDFLLRVYGLLHKR